jgi:hypothetical protein
MSSTARRSASVVLTRELQDAHIAELPSGADAGDTINAWITAALQISVRTPHRRGRQSSILDRSSIIVGILAQRGGKSGVITPFRSLVQNDDR